MDDMYNPFLDGTECSTNSSTTGWSVSSIIERKLSD